MLELGDERKIIKQELTSAVTDIISTHADPMSARRAIFHEHRIFTHSLA